MVSGGPSRSFRFNGSVSGFVGTTILASLLAALTFGIAVPWATVMVVRWVVEHTQVEGKRLVFLGSGGALFGTWLKWLLLIVLTLGIYSFWVMPRYYKWVIERIDFEDENNQSRATPARVEADDVKQET